MLSQSKGSYEGGLEDRGVVARGAWIKRDLLAPGNFTISKKKYTYQI